MRDILAEIWQRMNPVEPSASYLLKFMVAIVAVFALGLMIGHWG
ncbi:hypothetical protein [Primorskyibacter sp. 2E233]